jgi:hypothetical protein
MNQATGTSTIGRMLRSANRVMGIRRQLPASWRKAVGLLRTLKQRRDLERHVKKIRAEWQ